MASKNAGKQVGEPCGYCNTPLIQGKNGAYCKPCYIKYKDAQKSGQPSSQNSGGGSRNSEKTMVLSYAKDIEVANAKIGNRPVNVNNIFDDANLMMNWVQAPIPQNTPVQQPVSTNPNDQPLNDNNIPF